MKIREIIVVEGRDDTLAIKRAVQADTIETGGSALNKEKLARISLAKERRGVIIFTDPDYPGEKIRKTISEAIPGCKHAFLPKEKATSKKGKYGVEHASSEDIREALQHLKSEMDQTLEQGEEEISWAELQELGFIGATTSQDKREKMANKLGIGYCNGKQFYKRLGAFRISREEFDKAYQALIEEGSL
jgi:ribonuclease M5